MSEEAPVHEFDESRAIEYRPRADAVKTAILVRLADPDSAVAIMAPFGREVMQGDFYVVAAGEGLSYGAAKTEFEASHVEVAPYRWRKHTTVMAYQVAETCRIETRLTDGTHETTVDANPGDWLVRHAGGEVTVADPDGFAQRYERDS